MKFYFGILLSLLCFLFLGSCKERCEEIQTGSIALSSISKVFTPYSDGEEVTFTNQQGKDLVFTVSRVVEKYPICVKVLCDPVDPYKSRTCENYEGEGIRNILRSPNDTLLIELVVSTQNYQPESILFYDFFSVQMSAIGLLANGELIPFVHFSEPDFHEENSTLRTPLEFSEERVLLGQSYSDIYFTVEQKDQLFIQQDKGLVLLKIDDEWWKLKE